MTKPDKTKKPKRVRMMTAGPNVEMEFRVPGPGADRMELLLRFEDKDGEQSDMVIKFEDQKHYFRLHEMVEANMKGLRDSLFPPDK